MLPATFALLGAAMLILGLIALWQSLRHAFGAPTDAPTWTSTSETMEREGLLDEKRSLLESIKDLEFEHQVGKINDKDYERLDKQLRARAREVLRLLDQDIGPFRERAEALLQKHLQKSVGSTPYREKGEQQPANIRTCSECGTVNDVDAKFCKECAHRFVRTEKKTIEAKKKSKAKSKAKAKAKKPAVAKEPAEADETSAPKGVEAKVADDERAADAKSDAGDDEAKANAGDDGAKADAGDDGAKADEAKAAGDENEEEKR